MNDKDNLESLSDDELLRCLSEVSAIIKDTPQSASDLKPSIPRDLAKLLRRCLAKDPERRFQTCKDVRNELEDLKEALSTGELQASEVALSARPGSSRPWIFIGAVVLVVAGAILGALLWSPGRSPDSRIPRLTNPVQVTYAIGIENLPTWSPEGGRIAYMSDQSGRRLADMVSRWAAGRLRLGPRWEPRHLGDVRHG